MKLKKILIPAAAIAFMGSSLGFADYAMSIKPQTLEEAYKWQKDHYDVSWYNDMDPKEYVVKSYDGYELHTVLLKNPKPAAEGKRYVIVSHGYTDNRYGTLKYAKIYLDMGFNVIAYDLRGHGKNAPTFCTYSVREAKDLHCLIEDAYSRYGKDILLGLHGESLGAATSVAVLKYTQRPAFVVADCGFADITNVLKGGLRNMNPLLVPMVYPASAAAKAKYGYAFTEMRPIDSLKKNKVPVCFIHGADDTFISPKNSERMARENAGYSELHLVPDAEHAKSVLVSPNLYRRYVKEFLEKILIGV